jgi:signal transduction histidine kinase
MTERNTSSAILKVDTILKQLQAQKLPDETNSLIDQAVKSIRELTEVVAQEQEALNQDIQAAHQAKNKFVSVVTHELRVPMTSIKGYTDLMRQGIIGPVNEQQLNFLNVIRNNVERMSALIADLSDMSHIETGRLKLNPTPFPVKEQIEEALLVWEPRIKEKGLDLVNDIPDNLRMVDSDAGRFKQIIGNLVSNAFRYTEAGGKITVHARQENDQLFVEIIDTGIGISLADQSQLFTPFFRSDHEAVREHPGWGLALHVSKLLIELMGGQIGVRSSLGQGSTFWLSLPMHRVV